MKPSDEGINRTGENQKSKHFLILPAVSEDGEQNGKPGEKLHAQSRDSGFITFVGTATVIIRYAGLTILTDPNFLHSGDHVHLGYGLTSKRLTNPSIELKNLPHIDLIVLSHMHEDHFDRFVQKNLDRNIPIATTDEACEILKGLGVPEALSPENVGNFYPREGGYGFERYCHARTPWSSCHREAFAGSDGLSP